MRLVTSLVLAACGALLLVGAGAADGTGVEAAGLALLVAGIGGAVLALVWSPADARSVSGRSR